METKDSFIAAASAVAALLGALNVYLNNEASTNIERLKTQIVQIGEERKFAADIMQRFDNVVVDAKSDRLTRISRLEGLLALASLMRHDPKDAGGLNTEGILTVIRSQALAYKSEVANLSKSATGSQAEALQADYVRLDAIGDGATAALKKLAAAPAAGVAAAGSPAKATPFDRTRFDIFWCAGNDASADALADASSVARKRPVTSIADWRVRALTADKNASFGYKLTGMVVRADPAEVAVARQFVAVSGMPFHVDTLGGTPTPGYISVFICPA